jgi:LacI family transcriptional regulator
MAVTMKDIAEDLGLSIVTVSKVLRNHDDIGENTRERVLRRVKELGYRPNLTARSLVTGRSSLIGILVPGLLHPFFAEIARSLSAVLRKEGYYLIICSSEEDPQLEQKEIEHLLGRRIDALVVASVGGAKSAFDLVQQQNVPLVLIDRQMPDIDAHFVGVDDFSVGLLATEHLISLGCRRIAHIRGTETSTSLKRLEGYREALRRHEIAFDPSYIISVSTIDVDSTQRGGEAMNKILQLSELPDGVFCFSDPVAIGAMKVAHEKGINIPAEMSFIGCGNLHYDDSLRVPLSSVDQGSLKIGERTAELLLRILSSPIPLAPEQIITSPRLVVRASSRAAISENRTEGTI